MKVEVLADRGSGPPLVYVPGIDGSGELLLGTAPRLEARFRLIRLRYVLGGEASYRRVVSSLGEEIARLGVDRALFLAESFGGAVALRSALDRPQLVAGLTLVNSFAHYRRRFGLHAGRLLVPFIPNRLFELSRLLFGPAVLFSGRRERSAVCEFRRLRLSDWRSGYRVRLGMIAGLDLRPELPRVTQPVQVVAGTWDLVVDSTHQARQFAAHLPQVTVERIPRGGHLLLPLEQLDWPGRLGRLATAAGLAME